MQHTEQAQKAGYLLADHVFLCVDVDGAVLLDLRADKYIGLDGSQVRLLFGLVKGWPISPNNLQEGLSSTQSLSSERLLRSLLERGLITSNQNAGKDATPVTIEEPTEEVGADTWGGSATIGAVDLFHFSSAMLTATLGLRLRSIEGTIRHVRARKRVTPAENPSIKDSLARSLTVFVQLRPFILTSRDKCLVESLALIEFLSRKGIFPTWVFAVHSNPFSAHCWLQLGSLVINDTLDNVRNFTPIMVV